MEEIDERVQQALAGLIKDLRHRSGLSQLELAEKIGKTKQAVSCYERGVYSPTISVLIQVADACGTTLSDIFNDLSAQLGIEVSDIEAERQDLEREIEMSHDALDRAGVPRNESEGSDLPFSVPERVRHLAAAMQAIDKERAAAQRDISAAQDDMTSAGVKLEAGMSLTDRVRSLIRSKGKISEGEERFVLKLNIKGEVVYDIDVEKGRVAKSLDIATRRSLSASQTRAGLLEWAGVGVSILRVDS
jgi:putative transcriptional regulator